MGRLILEDDPLNELQTNRDTYMSPDGARHTLYPTLHEGEPASPDILYSRDGSYLRFKKLLSQVEFPDGTKHTFNAGGFPTKIEDRFNNAVNICYDCCPWQLDGKCKPADLPWPWKITDSHNREHWVEFRATGYSNQPAVVSKVKLDAFGGQEAVYTFGYNIDSGEPPTVEACRTKDPQTMNLAIVLLTSMARPDGSSYTMPDHFLANPQGPCRNGMIRRLGLPTLGSIEWDYITYTFPPESALNRGFFQNTAGVGSRKLKDESGNILGTWTYTSNLTAKAAPGEPYKELVNTVIDPLGHKVKRYFSVCPDNCGATAQRAEYGLPLSRRLGLDTSGRALSSEILHQNGTHLRSTYVRYERDADPSSLPAPDLQDWTRLNQRQVSQRTVFHDDANRSGAENLSDFDGYGHYRGRSTNGNFPGSNIRSATTGYNPARGTYGQPGFTSWPAATPWVLGTYSFAWESEAGQLLYRSFCFDQNGFLLGRRVHAANNSSYSANDLVEVFTNDSRGNIQNEKYFGGDLQPITTDANLGYICALINSLTAPVYKVDHVYTHGMRSKSSSASGGVTLNFVDQTIDKNTGLPSSSRDMGNQQTDFQYDLLGRMTSMTPPDEVATLYTYQKATPGVGLAQATVSKGVNGPYGQSRITFDALGRPRYEEQRMPDQSYAKRETNYNALGWKTRVTEMDSAYSTQFFGYDPFGRPTSIQPPDSAAHSVTLTYAGISEVSRATKVATSATTETTATTKEVYDRHGRLYEVTEPNGVVTRYEYDAGSRLKKVCQGVNVITGVCGQERAFTYDNRGLLLWENHPEKTANTLGLGHDVDYLSYDARGHATRKVDGASDLTFGYDKFERLTQIRQTGAGNCVTTAGSSPLCLKSFTYSGANGTLSNGATDWSKGKLTAASRHNYIGAPFNAAVEVKESYQYGGKGGRLSQKDTSNIFNGAQKEEFRQTFVWNVAGELSSHTYPDCLTPSLCGSAPRSQGYGYTRGHLTSVPGFATSITYHPSGMLNTIVRSNGVTDLQAVDPQGMARPAEISAMRTSDSLGLWTTGAYQYDGSGNIWKTGLGVYLYDGLSRVVSGKVYPGRMANGTPSTQTYTYDNYGNLTGTTTNGTLVNTPAATATNRLTAGTYDASGNLTAWSGNSYEYDAFNQMSRHVSSGEDWRYIYTADDERFWSYKVGGGSSLWTLRGLRGEALREYSAHLGWNNYRDQIYRDGTLLTTVASAAAGGAVKHFHTDHLGTPRLITDAAGNPATVQYHAYYPYGEELATTYTSAYTEKMRFTGHERDLVNLGGQGDDLDYMHARHYGVVTGRFLSTDRFNAVWLQFGDENDQQRFRELLAQPQAWNLFAYTSGNPLKYSDPDGESATLVLAAPWATGSGSSVGIAAVANPAGALFLAGAGGYLVGTGINAIPGVSETIQSGLGLIIDTVYLAQSTKDNLKLTSGLIAAAQTELGKITAAGGPEKDPDGRHHQAEIKAMLTRAERIAKRLPTKLRTQALQVIQQIAQKAGVTL
jgi:RHS repeat-associated protein